MMQRANLLQTLQMTNESVRGTEPFANTTLDVANPANFDPFAMTGDITGFGDKSQSAIEHPAQRLGNRVQHCLQSWLGG